MNIPPPEEEAELPLTLQLVTVNTDWELRMPPPSSCSRW